MEAPCIAATTSSQLTMISQLYMARASEPSLGRHEIHTILPSLPSSAAGSGATAADRQFSADSSARDKKSTWDDSTHKKGSAAAA